MPEYVFETTIEMACWKRHTCVACGCVYQYELVAEGVGSADARSFSGAQAEKSAMRKLELEMEPHPCPTCGVYQPDMIAGPRLTGHNWLFVAVLVIIFPAALIALFGLFPSYLVGVAVGILATLAAVGQIAVALQNPNADLPGNKALAQAEMKAGELRLIQSGNPAESQPALGRPRFGLGLILVTLAGPALIAPVLIALAFGLPYQSDIRPQYVGAGERMIITFPRENVASISGAWKGKASAVLIAADQSPSTLEAVAGEERYGRIILHERSAPTVSPCQLFAHVQLPDDDALDGKTIQIRLSMDVTYPLPKGRRQFVEKTTTVTRDVEVQVAERMPLRLYNGFGIFALVAGWGGIVVGSGVLVFQAWRDRAQTEGGLVIPVEPDE